MADLDIFHPDTYVDGPPHELFARRTRSNLDNALKDLPVRLSR